MATGSVSDLATRWIRAWTYARGLEVSQLDGWPLVRVGSATRETELVCVEPGTHELTALMSHVAGDPRAMLTVIAEDIAPYTSFALPPGVRADRDDETLMATPLSSTSLRSLDPIYSARWDVLGNQVKYVVEHQDRVAAEGLVAVLGADAVYDAVETTPAYQRRGLGRHVMAALGNRAIESGATTGILAATASGRLLYESLGWQPVSAMWSVMGDTLDS